MLLPHISTVIVLFLSIILWHNCICSCYLLYVITDSSLGNELCMYLCYFIYVQLIIKEPWIDLSTVTCKWILLNTIKAYHICCPKNRPVTQCLAGEKQWFVGFNNSRYCYKKVVVINSEPVSSLLYFNSPSYYIKLFHAAASKICM